MIRCFVDMYTCQVIREKDLFRFECLDDRAFSVFRSIEFPSREAAISQLNRYIHHDLEYICEVCEGEDGHYIKMTHDGITLLESRPFDNPKSAYDFLKKWKGGGGISHIIDKSFEDGHIHYLTSTSALQFKDPIKITIESEDHQFIGSIPEFNIYTYSDDLKEVINELKLDLDELFDDLFVKGYKLSPKAQQIKKEFESKLKLNGVS